MKSSSARRCALLVVTATLVVAAACGPGEAPRVDDVEPPIGLEGTETAVTIRGAAFAWSYDAFGDTLQGEFAVEVGGEAASDVVWVDASTLEAVFPALDPGRYDVSVQTAHGRGSQAEAFVVRPAGPPGG
jgi:hypothetical protein